MGHSCDFAPVRVYVCPCVRLCVRLCPRIGRFGFTCKAIDIQVLNLIRTGIRHGTQISQGYVQARQHTVTHIVRLSEDGKRQVHVYRLC